MTRRKIPKLTQLRDVLDSPVDLGKELDLGTVSSKSLLNLMLEFPGLIRHLALTKYGKMLFENEKTIRRIARRELKTRIIAKHNLNPEAAALFRRKAAGLNVAKQPWTRYKSIVEPALIEFQEKNDRVDKGVDAFIALKKLRERKLGIRVETKVYSEEAIEAAFYELIELARWMNERHGFYPVVLGGWAVYAYHPDSGDIEVRILFPSKVLADDVLAPFYMARNYQAGGLWEKFYYKETKRRGKKIKVFLLAEHVNDSNVLHENPSIKIPWDLALKNTRLWRVGNTTFRIPTKEVLLLLEVKALRDKQFDLGEARDISAFRKNLLKSMIEKSKKDVITLVDFIKPKVNVIKLRKLLEETHFSPYFAATLAELNIDLKKDFKN